MNSSRIILTAALLALAVAARAADAPKTDSPKTNAKSAEHNDACPNLTGKFSCPAVEKFKQKAMTITVKSDPAKKTFEFSYDDGAKPVKVTADGKRSPTGKEWSSYVCRNQALIQIVFKDPKTMKSSGGSMQRLDKDGAYEVSGPDGKIDLLCPRAK